MGKQLDQLFENPGQEEEKGYSPQRQGCQHSHDSCSSLMKCHFSHTSGTSDMEGKNKWPSNGYMFWLLCLTKFHIPIFPTTCRKAPYSTRIELRESHTTYERENGSWWRTDNVIKWKCILKSKLPTPYAGEWERDYNDAVLGLQCTNDTGLSNEPLLNPSKWIQEKVWRKSKCKVMQFFHCHQTI